MDIRLKGPKEEPVNKPEVQKPQVTIKGTKRGYQVTVVMRKKLGYYRTRSKQGNARTLAKAEAKAEKYSKTLMREEYKELAKHALLVEHGHAR